MTNEEGESDYFRWIILDSRGSRESGPGAAKSGEWELLVEREGDVAMRWWTVHKNTVEPFLRLAADISREW